MNIKALNEIGARHMAIQNQLNNSYTLVLGGAAGQGIQFIETILVTSLKQCGYHVFATKEYMSRIRGGINTTEIRIGNSRVQAHVEKIDLLLPLKQGVIEHLDKRVDENTIIVGDRAALGTNGVHDIPFTEISAQLGNKIFSNAVALGVISEILQIDESIIHKEIGKKLSGKSEDIITKNIEAIKSGRQWVKEKAEIFQNSFTLSRHEEVKDELVMSGADAITLGSLAGGCNAAFAYPMTPGSSVFLNLAKLSSDHDILVEQVEDEIGVVNMALGAWYAGARPIISTSGGGFALMTEGISLAGMIESPLVVHLAQRPGPATGLPTRTEQGDLNLVRYAGHGDFPRIILSPGTLEQGFSLAQKAFDMADTYQVPVFILTDQFYVDTYYNTPKFLCENVGGNSQIIQTDDEYKRYALTESGISPRSIPGAGSGRVCVDSDEHDETGHITEDLDGVRVPMADKRMRKHEIISKNVLEPELIGPKNYKTLLIGWGSTYTAIKEALEYIVDDNIAFLFCPQVYPLPSSFANFLNAAEQIIAIENNQIGHFADLIQGETGIQIKTRILKYNGMPFSVEELVERIRREL